MSKKVKYEPKSLKQAQTELVLSTLKAHDFNRTHAAKDLGIHPRTLVRMIDRLKYSGVVVEDSKFNELRQKV